MVFSGMFALPMAGSGAEDRFSTACRFEDVSTGKIRAVADGRSFVLDDGREIRLAGIEVPFPPVTGETGARAEGGNRARAALADMVAGRDVEVLRTGAPDRYGRIMAQAYVRDGDSGSARSVTNHMLA